MRRLPDGKYTIFSFLSWLKQTLLAGNEASQAWKYTSPPRYVEYRYLFIILN